MGRNYFSIPKFRLWVWEWKSNFIPHFKYDRMHCKGHAHNVRTSKKKKKKEKETQISRNESFSVYGYLIYDMAFLGIITNGGEKPNIIPEQASLEYLIRTPTKGEICALKERTHACFLASATATGCEVTTVRCKSHSEHGDVMTWSRLNFLIHA